MALSLCQSWLGEPAYFPLRYVRGKKVLQRNSGSLSNLDNLVNLMSLEQVTWEACESKEGGCSHLETIVIFI